MKYPISRFVTLYRFFLFISPSFHSPTANRSRFLSSRSGINTKEFIKSFIDNEN